MRSDKREFSGAFPVVKCFPVQRLYHRIDRTLKVKLVTEVGNATRAVNTGKCYDGLLNTTLKIRIKFKIPSFSSTVFTTR